MKHLNYKLAAVLTASAFIGQTSQAQATGFQEISDNIQDSVQNVPQLLAVLSYLVGIAFAIAGVLKLKAHVDNPNNAPLKDGVMRLGAAGALLALPTILDAVISTIGDGGTGGNFTDIESSLEF